MDPSPILSSNGTIVLFYLPALFGQDPAQCPAGQTSCTKYIMSATEVNGSRGSRFIVDPGYRAAIQVQGGCCGSDPSIFKGQSSYILYASQVQSVLAFSSQKLQGSYAPISGLQGGMLSQQNGGVPEGHYDPQARQYFTYVTYAPQGGTAVIKLAVTQSINSSIAPQSFGTVISGCSFSALGCGYSVESPGFWPMNGTR